jgi:hypothetical protein
MAASGNGYQRQKDGSVIATLTGQTGAASMPTDWQTPSATCADAGATPPANWTTPTRHDGEHGPQSKARAEDPKHLGRCLQYDVKQPENWPTATARDYRSPCASEATHEKNSRPLSEVVGQQDQENPSTNGKPRGSLNSAWVMQLMGFPDEYAQELTRLLCAWSATHGRTNVP